MKVKEIIEKLKTLNPDLEVKVFTEGGVRVKLDHFYEVTENWNKERFVLACDKNELEDANREYNFIRD